MATTSFGRGRPVRGEIGSLPGTGARPSATHQRGRRGIARGCTWVPRQPGAHDGPPTYQQAHKVTDTSVQWVTGCAVRPRGADRRPGPGARRTRPASRDNGPDERAAGRGGRAEGGAVAVGSVRRLRRVRAVLGVLGSPAAVAAGPGSGERHPARHRPPRRGRCRAARHAVERVDHRPARGPGPDAGHGGVRGGRRSPWAGPLAGLARGGRRSRRRRVGDDGRDHERGGRLGGGAHRAAADARRPRDVLAGRRGGGRVGRRRAVRGRRSAAGAGGGRVGDGRRRPGDRPSGSGQAGKRARQVGAARAAAHALAPRCSSWAGCARSPTWSRG